MQGQLAFTLHNNYQLFSDHYLDTILLHSANFKALVEEAAAVKATLVALYEGQVGQLPLKNEAQLEEAWVRPILTALGFTFEVQQSLKTPDGTKKPDYVFYRDGAARAALQGKTLDDEVLRSGAVAVGDAKAWSISLDKVQSQKSVDPFSNKNPSYQIYFYMLYSGMDWGILTNGRQWRLYHKETAHKLDRYYEVDLISALTSDNPDAFLYFYAFFRRAAFDDHALSLNAILRESRDYARHVGDTIRKQVYDALEHLAQGFLDYKGNGLAADAGTLKEIYDNSLIVLYRLLFVFYAEARDLLPLRTNETYKRYYSLLAIKQTVSTAFKEQRVVLAGTDEVWSRLRSLFNAVNTGEPKLGVATFNGGLFDPQRHPFLEQYRVGDERLYHAIDLLARVGGEFVDYRDLAERHLGTIYEGLLENRLRPDTEREGFTIGLFTDKGERKGTGSFYTPDYIVKYIVEQTVGPVLDAAVAGVEDEAGKVAAVLGLNVVDPAMGSGHFLVEAMEYIARFLVDTGITPADRGAEEADVLYWKRRVVQSCIYGVDLNPLAVDLAKLSLWLATVAEGRPLSFLDHHLRTGNALVGAQLEELQFGVEPAAKGKKGKAKAVPEAQGSLFDVDDFRQTLTTAVTTMAAIEAVAADSVEAVKRQETDYLALREQLARSYGQLADAVTASRFGLEVPADQWKGLAKQATGKALGEFRQLRSLL